ncbi:hypothetical protein [Aliicoccus persicus]|uniref:Uncharacterized protein n=1 Tax=Aliicoccus persicus TaxID=930138 RepID=A0A662Z4Y9_9STAP|nr:hypothetical protein [Aliicoccus persicus]SEV86441.1 hypothetical protein SAMN05192557_0582 [Aliicoccus persicus]
MVRYSGVPKVRKSKQPLNDELLDEKYSEINKEIEEELLKEQEKMDGEDPDELLKPEKKAWRNKIILIAIIVGLTMMIFRLMGRTLSFVMFFF